MTYKCWRESGIYVLHQILEKLFEIQNLEN